MDLWSAFYNEEDLLRAKKEQLETVIQILPWVAIVDKFQHWLYTHPNHTREERKEQWNTILNDFSGGIVDWSGYEKIKDYSWQKQLHIFEVPFYYIEYGMAQLGAPPVGASRRRAARYAGRTPGPRARDTARRRSVGTRGDGWPHSRHAPRAAVVRAVRLRPADLSASIACGAAGRGRRGRAGRWRWARAGRATRRSGRPRPGRG